VALNAGLEYEKNVIQMFQVPTDILEQAREVIAHPLVGPAFRSERFMYSHQLHEYTYNQSLLQSKVSIWLIFQCTVKSTTLESIEKFRLPVSLSITIFSSSVSEFSVLSLGQGNQ
jgi:hypothetical protein